VLLNGIPHRAESSQRTDRHHHAPNQFAHVCAEVERQGFADRIRVHLLGYHGMPREWKGSFDRVCEHRDGRGRGTDNMDAYWAAIDHRLREDAAYGVIQSIAIPEASRSSFSNRKAFATVQSGY